MSSSIFGTLHTARSGIVAQQTSLSVTGNNIANVNTKGYSRQRTVLENISTGGVKVGGIERLRDEFLTARVRDSNARLGSGSTLALNLQQVEAALGESAEQGIGQSIQKFFSAWQELSIKPNGTTERENVRQSATQLITNFQSITGQISQIRDQIDQQVVQQVDQVNLLTSQIADLNRQISGQSGSQEASQHPELNSLLDQRDNLIDQLSSIVQVRTITDESGSVTLFGGSQVLVEGNNSHALGTTVNNANSGYHEVTITDSGGQPLSIADKLTEGSLGALLQARDGYALDAQTNVERLSAQLARDLNVQHRQGMGLDGVTGRDFFTGLQVTAAAPIWTNQGGVNVSSTAILDDSQLSFDDYEIRFTNSSTFDIVNVSDGTTLSTGNAYTPGGNIDFLGMRVVLNNASGPPVAGDVITVNAYANTTHNLGLAAGVASDTQAIAAGQSSSTGDNTNSLLISELSSQATMGSPASKTYTEFYDTLRLRISTATATAQQSELDEQTMQTQVSALASGVSGVSTDDEAIDLIQFQRAFEASSRVVNVVDELLQTILGMAG